jgi:SIR2-like domain
MLERRLDDQTRGDSRVRREVANRLHAGGRTPTPIHRTLMRLADRGGATTIVTTNFDLLLEQAAKRSRSSIETYSLGSVPRPTRHTDFAGVLHIHGALDSNPLRFSELVLSDRDFGEFYLRRRVVPDFIYDAARLFHLVLVGYTIQRFLVPFACWSMVNYGLYGEADGAKKLAQINDEEKAKALLRLLDLTVGSAEGATIPNDLADALEQIRSVAPDLVEDPTFRRLSAAARR